MIRRHEGREDKTQQNHRVIEGRAARFTVGKNTEIYLPCQESHPNWDKSGTFSDDMSIHFSSVINHTLISDLIKFRICPIWAQSDRHLTHI